MNPNTPTPSNHYTPNHLIAHNANLLVDALEKKSAVEARRDALGYTPFSSYALPAITELLRAVLNEPEVELTVIARKKFGDDLCLKLPRLLKEQGSAPYMQTTIPQITATLASDERTRELFAGVAVKGIYINLRLTSERIASFLTEIIAAGPRYGESDLWRGNGIVVDYSSPNLAKNLHAGHIRSTIIGHILSNLYEAVGGYVYRTNHVNDLGGVGYLIAGYRRWSNLLPADKTKGQQLAALYLIFRSLQKVFDGGASEPLFSSTRDQIRACFPEADSAEAFLKAFAGYKEESTAIQELLERGDPDTVSTWAIFVSWSLEEFQRFYDILGVSIDFVLGESFYLPGALSLIRDAVTSGAAVVWTAEHAATVESRFADQLAREEIAQPLFETLVKEARQDIGATVVPLSDRERVVILRADGVSIYTSRDLEAIRFRALTFSPRRIVYEVGVEQNEHFAQLFAAARQLHLCNKSVELVHVAHESYIDASTKKKLSSRHGSSGVEELLSSTVRYFKDKYGAEAGFSEAETDKIAHQLGVGSIIFNDIKKDKRYPVEVQEDLRKMHEEFERSGGAYVVYTACRARSIIRKWGKAVPAITECPGALELDPAEIELIKELSLYPQKLAEAARTDSPSVLAQYLLDLSRSYNSYYASFPVIKGDVVHEHRLVITKAVQTVLENGLKICAIECPERI
jgi:arginyl-tRNA synthetase